MGSGTRPPMLTAAAAVLTAEAAALLVYTVMNVVAIATGNSYQASNGAGLIILQLIMMAFLLWLAVGVLKLQPWTRTPSVMVQVLIGVVAVFLIEAHQYPWGAITLVLAVAGLVSLLTPASVKALARPMPADEPTPAKTGGDAKPTAKPTAKSSAKPDAKSSAKPTAKSGPGKGKSGNPAKRDAAAKPSRPSGKSASR